MKQKEVAEFLQEHKLRPEDTDIQALVESMTSEMMNGLEGKESSLRMIPTYIEADNEFLTEVPVVAVDAGGTNFRCALVTFSKQGRLDINNMLNADMPGLDGEISKDEFFRTIAGYIKPSAKKANRIGFCFSYPTEIFPDKDGKLLQFCKEVQAPGVVGQLIGKNLLKALGMPEKQIVLLNDTVATLLAGKSASFGKNYDSFIGYILGTGTNTCYIERNSNIRKKSDIELTRNQIINIESGSYGKAPQSDLDVMFCNTTADPDSYKFEKMISGGYIGGLSLLTLKTAAKEGLFAKETSYNILSLKELSAEEVNKFVSDPSCDGLLNKNITTKTDNESCIKIIENLTSRSAKLVAGNLASVILKTEKGRSADRPILITVEGSIYYKFHNLRSLITKYLQDYLTGSRKRYFEFMEVKHSSLVGAALAALIN